MGTEWTPLHHHPSIPSRPSPLIAVTGLCSTSCLPAVKSPGIGGGGLEFILNHHQERERAVRGERERGSVCVREREGEREGRGGAANHGNHQHHHHLQLRRALSRLLSSSSSSSSGLALHARSSDLLTKNNPQPACRRKQNKRSGIFRVINSDHVARR